MGNVENSVIEGAEPSIRGIEGVTIQLENAPFLRRLGAYVIDLAVVTGCLYFFIILLFFVGVMVVAAVSSLSQTAGAIAGWGAVVVGLIIMLGLFDTYFIYYEFKKGSTLGKRLMGLRVVTLEGTKPSLGQCVARDMMRYIDCALLFPGPIAIAFSKNGQRFGDMIAHTRVVYSKRAEAAQSCLYIDHDKLIMYLSESPSQTMSRAFAKEFMTYASKRFLLNDSEYAAGQNGAEWLARYEKETGQRRPSSVDDEECLRFFAECCVRRLAKADKSSDTV